MPTRRPGSPPSIGFPVMIKASAGGGGRACASPDRGRAAERASRQRAARGGERLRQRHRLPGELHRRAAPRRDPDPRRQHGNVVHLGERECSIQRRHQKMIEESPSRRRGRGDLLRRWERLRSRPRKAVDYVSAGHRRVPLDSRRRVLFPGDEHPPPGGTPGDRAGTGSTWWRAVARGRGRAAPLARSDITPAGHAIECRINARGLRPGLPPSPGR